MISAIIHKLKQQNTTNTTSIIENILPYLQNYTSFGGELQLPEQYFLTFQTDIW